MSKHPTLIKPPKSLPHHSPIENALQLLPLVDIGQDVFTNARALWHPPGARGIFGGAAIAQCLSAAQATIQAEHYAVHSMHCYFVLAGDASIPILYHVERVRDGKSFVTRTVQARQRGKCIFTTTISFMREGSGGQKTVNHTSHMPNIEAPPEGGPRDASNIGDTPFETVPCGVAKPEHGTTTKPAPHEKKMRTWMRARGRISECPPNVREHEIMTGRRLNQPGDNHQAHLSALAYMSDSHFIGTVARVHQLQRFANARNIERTLKAFVGSEEERQQMKQYLENIAAAETAENAERDPNDDRRIGMMVSLDHSIYFHNPRSFRADEWMLTEMESPWAGDGRGLVIQRIWAKDGTMIATCVQEGVVRLQQEREIKL